eukprot:gene5278-18523_t
MARLVARGFGTLRDQYGANEIKLEQLRTIKKLGEGAFAYVEKCEYTDKGGEKNTVAVKKLKPGIMQNPDDVDTFMSEVNPPLRKLES